VRQTGAAGLAALAAGNDLLAVLLHASTFPSTKKKKGPDRLVASVGTRYH
jgi:hypothetical protein